MPPVLRPRKPIQAAAEPTVTQEKPKTKPKKKETASKPLARKQVAGASAIRKASARKTSKKTLGETPVQQGARSEKGGNQVVGGEDPHVAPPESSFQVVIFVGR